MKNNTAALLIIGNEILSGRTVDANLNVIARRLTDVGVPLREVRVVPDIEEEIIHAVNTLREKFTYVFTTGGIGPTHDDITTACIAKAFNVPVIRDESVETMLRARGRPTTEATFKMADFPEGAHLIHVPNDIPPGFYIGNVYVFAGVPNIMRLMLESVLPLLEQGEKIISQSIDVLASESLISAGLEEIQNHYPDLELGSYPFRTGDTYGTSLVVRGSNPRAVETAFAQMKKFVQELGVSYR